MWLVLFLGSLQLQYFFSTASTCLARPALTSNNIKRYLFHVDRFMAVIVQNFELK